MGKTLAIMHWRVGTDARDVEFVLGSGPNSVEESLISSFILKDMEEPVSTWKEVTHPNFRSHAIRLWMLDFNQCRRIQPDDSGIATAVQAYFLNDPYFPRPLSTNIDEKILWSRFEAGYLETGREAIRTSIQEQHPWQIEIDLTLPDRFIKSCIEEEGRRIKIRADAEQRLVESDYR
jgi:hypothetical protein